MFDRRRFFFYRNIKTFIQISALMYSLVEYTRSNTCVNNLNRLLTKSAFLSGKRIIGATQRLSNASINTALIHCYYIVINTRAHCFNALCSPTTFWLRLRSSKFVCVRPLKAEFCVKLTVISRSKMLRSFPLR